MPHATFVCDGRAFSLPNINPSLGTQAIVPMRKHWLGSMLANPFYWVSKVRLAPDCAAQLLAPLLPLAQRLIHCFSSLPPSLLTLPPHGHSHSPPFAYLTQVLGSSLSKAMMAGVEVALEVHAALTDSPQAQVS